MISDDIFDSNADAENAKYSIFTYLVKRYILAFGKCHETKKIMKYLKDNNIYAKDPKDKKKLFGELVRSFTYFDQCDESHCEHDHENANAKEWNTRAMNLGQLWDCIMGLVHGDEHSKVFSLLEAKDDKEQDTGTILADYPELKEITINHNLKKFCNTHSIDNEKIASKWAQQQRIDTLKFKFGKNLASKF